MLEALRKFLDSGAGKATAVVVVLIGLVFAGYTLKNVTTSEAVEESANRMFIDSETGKPFPHRIEIGDPIPTKAPSGKMTGYPAEACYWTKDGKVKETPTYVYVPGVWTGSKDPTFCPDCGRLVVGHNPRATAERTPPPTKEEYAQGKGRRGSSRQ